MLPVAVPAGMRMRAGMGCPEVAWMRTNAVMPPSGPV
ncbi:MAG: hypothetical protein AVDCRST_MAG57-3820 [uncultured Blastococcus sp.]|uniref:Uncharacterized protein n=1 Tax=uncultured Blastococcus sp. TaxID=217144 RepID=A0A6J4JKR7_9ACTN|nr:MAG: hypothetical protein AVDCRST_MAG57-3820 [uncultured Blastococcus sp.]